MALLLSEIEWSAPILPRVDDPAWVATIKRRGAPLGECEQRVASSPWIRELCLWVLTYRARDLSERLATMGAMVSAQENACRYCYGALRAAMKMLGYSEATIGRIERDLRIAELDAKAQGYVAFCRKLARARPRPARAEREALIALGYAPLTVNEIAFQAALGTFHSRVTALIACPPEQFFEKLANGPVGFLVGLMEPLLRARSRRRQLAHLPAPPPAEALQDGAFAPVVQALDGLPAAAVMKSALDAAIASEVLSRSVKALMFAVVARALDCPHTEAGARDILRSEGLSDAEIETALATLRCDRLPPAESDLLSWARDTVHYEPGPIQKAGRALCARIGERSFLEAVGVAALANMTVRLSMLLE
ncbi:MAG: hypothetical protein M9915_01930 [Rhizobacter sp.]|nr:hypothetical protein [Rhizobacter sp.]